MAKYVSLVKNFTLRPLSAKPMPKKGYIYKLLFFIEITAIQAAIFLVACTTTHDKACMINNKQQAPKQ